MEKGGFWLSGVVVGRFDLGGERGMDGRERLKEGYGCVWVWSEDA